MISFPRPMVCPRHVGTVQRSGIAFSLMIALVGTTIVPTYAMAPGTPDPEVVKKKVEKLGVGEHVAVKRVVGKTLHGRITGIGEQSFKLRADNATLETEIAYGQVLNVKKNPGALTWMLVGAVLVIVIIVAAR